MNPSDLLDGMGGVSPKKALLEDVYETPDGETYSQADIIADMVNILRADTAMLGQILGVEVETKKMTPERAAEIFHDAVMGDPTQLIETFNEMEDQRDRIIYNSLPEEQYRAFTEHKRDNVYSASSSDDADGGDVVEDDVGVEVEEAEQAVEELREETEQGDRIEEESDADETTPEEPEDEPSQGGLDATEDDKDGVPEDVPDASSYIETTDDLLHNFDYDQLTAAAKELREDTDEFSLQGATKEDIAEFILDRPMPEVASALTEPLAEVVEEIEAE